MASIIQPYMVTDLVQALINYSIILSGILKLVSSPTGIIDKTIKILHLPISILCATFFGRVRP